MDDNNDSTPNVGLAAVPSIEITDHSVVSGLSGYLGADDATCDTGTNSGSSRSFDDIEVATDRRNKYDRSTWASKPKSPEGGGPHRKIGFRCFNVIVQKKHIVAAVVLLVLVICAIGAFVLVAGGIGKENNELEGYKSFGYLTESPTSYPTLSPKPTPLPSKQPTRSPTNLPTPSPTPKPSPGKSTS